MLGDGCPLRAFARGAFVEGRGPARSAPLRGAEPGPRAPDAEPAVRVPRLVAPGGLVADPLVACSRVRELAVADRHETRTAGALGELGGSVGRRRFGEGS